MGEVLSQNEIDNLLQALTSGELDVDEIKNSDNKQVKSYDFARPAKFSKEHLRTLEIIFDHYVRLLTTNLSVYLRKNAQINVISSEALSFSDFSNSLSNPVLIGIVNFEPLAGKIIIEIAPNLGFDMIDRMLGGQGNAPLKKRDFSEIELSIIEKIFTVCINLLKEPWKNVVSLRPKLERIETNTQFSQIISPTEMTAIITIQIQIGETEGFMNICLPYITLADVMDKLNTKYWFSTMQKKGDDSYEELIESMITKASMPIKAVLGHSSITVNDFVNLQVGDIIRLNADIDNELDVYVGNIKKFKALPGASKDAYAVRVTSIIREES